MKTNPQRLKRTNVRLPERMHSDLKKFAAEQRLSIEQIVARAIAREIRGSPSEIAEIQLGTEMRAGLSRWQRLRKLAILRSGARAAQQQFADELSDFVGAASIRLPSADTSVISAYMAEIPASAVVKDLKGRIIWANRDYEDLCGLPLQLLKGKTALDLWPSTFARVIVQHDALVARGRGMQVVELLPGPDGSIRHRLALRFPIRTAAHKIFRTACIAFDLPEIPDSLGPLYRADIYRKGF